MTTIEIRTLASRLAAELFSHTHNQQEAQEIVRQMQWTIDWVYAEPQGSTP